MKHEGFITETKNKSQRLFLTLICVPGRDGGGDECVSVIKEICADFGE